MKKDIGMSDINKDLRFIHTYMMRNKDLSERLIKDLNMRPSYIKKGCMETFVEEYKEDCNCITDFKKKHTRSYSWIYRNNKIDEFKKLVGINFEKQKEDKLNDLVNKWKSKITQITDVKMDSEADMAWLSYHGFLDEFKKRVGLI